MATRSIRFGLRGLRRARNSPRVNGFLLSLLKFHDIGTLVGSSSSGGYTCSDASRNSALRNTGLRLRYSTRAFCVAAQVQKLGIDIEPDIRVEWTIDGYLAGNDPVLAAVLDAAGIDAAEMSETISTMSMHNSFMDFNMPGIISLKNRSRADGNLSPVLIPPAISTGLKLM